MKWEKNLSLLCRRVGVSEFQYLFLAKPQRKPRTQSKLLVRETFLINLYNYVLFKSDLQAKRPRSIKDPSNGRSTISFDVFIIKQVGCAYAKYGM